MVFIYDMFGVMVIPSLCGRFVGHFHGSMQLKVVMKLTSAYNLLDHIEFLNNKLQHSSGNQKQVILSKYILIISTKRVFILFKFYALLELKLPNPKISKYLTHKHR